MLDKHIKSKIKQMIDRGESVCERNNYISGYDMVRWFEDELSTLFGLEDKIPTVEQSSFNLDK